MIWYVVYTKPGEEIRARDNLDRQGYGPFLPMCKEPRKASIRPLFPRYLFIPCRKWTAPIDSTYGVQYLLKYGDVPASLGNDIIEELKARMDPDIGAVVLEDNRPPARQFKDGEELRIINGPYVGRAGLFVARAKDRVRVLLTMFGRQMTVPVREEDVA